jgi:hypothetical protein
VTWADHDLIHEGIQAGVFSVAAIEAAHVVTFPTPMPDTNYLVFIQAQGSAGASAYPSNFTVDGFTANMPIGANATLAYIAVKM